MTQRVDHALASLVQTQDDQGRALARHGVVLTKIEEALAAAAARGQAAGRQIDEVQDTVDELEAKVDLIVRHLGIIPE